jgi:hypothetical protein
MGSSRMAEMQVKEKRPGLHKALFGPFKLTRIEGKANIVGLAGGNPGKCESEVRRRRVHCLGEPIPE